MERALVSVLLRIIHHLKSGVFVSTNVQRWPQDPYFHFSSLVLHLSDVWKCEITLLSFLIPSSTLLRCVEVWNSHTFPLVSKPLVILYLVLHFSEVWKCGKVWQSKHNVTLFPWSRTPCHSFFSFTLLRGVEVWKVWQSKDNVTLFTWSRTPFHSLLSSTLLRSRCGSVEKSDKVRIMSHFSPGHEHLVILYLVLHFWEVWKCGKVWPSEDNVTLFPWSRTSCHSLLSSTLLRGVEVWNNLTESGCCRAFPQSRIHWHSFFSYTRWWVLVG